MMNNNRRNFKVLLVSSMSKYLNQEKRNGIQAMQQKSKAINNFSSKEKKKDIAGVVRSRNSPCKQLLSLKNEDETSNDGLK